eukprot:6562820-Alexandrium_andersonii.AAC.1
MVDRIGRSVRSLYNMPLYLACSASGAIPLKHTLRTRPHWHRPSGDFTHLDKGKTSERPYTSTGTRRSPTSRLAREREPRKSRKS